MKCFICKVNEGDGRMVMVKAINRYDRLICRDCWINKRYRKYMSFIERIKDFFNII